MPDSAVVSESEIRTFRREGVVTVDFVKVIGPKLYEGLVQGLCRGRAQGRHNAGRDQIGWCGPALHLS